MVLAELFHPVGVGFVGFEIVFPVVICSGYFGSAVWVHVVVRPSDRAFVVVGSGIVGRTITQCGMAGDVLKLAFHFVITDVVNGGAFLKFRTPVQRRIPVFRFQGVKLGLFYLVEAVGSGEDPNIFQPAVIREAVRIRGVGVVIIGEQLDLDGSVGGSCVEQIPFGFCLSHGRSIGACSAERRVVVLARLAGVNGGGRPVSRPLIGVAVPFIHLVRVIVGVGKPVGGVCDGFGSRSKGSAGCFVCASVVGQQFVFGRSQSLANRPRGDYINGEYCRLGLNGRQRGGDAGERKDGENADAVQQALLGRRCRRFHCFRCSLHGFLGGIVGRGNGAVKIIFVV